MRKLAIALLGLIMMACQEQVDLPLATIDGEVIIIEGEWTDQPNFNEVKISLAQNYFDTTSRRVIENAEVNIAIPGTEVVIPFIYVGASESYRPISDRMVAEIGNTYELQIAWEENFYVARGLMLEPPVLDSLTYKFEEERTFRDEGYFITAFGKIPFEEDNFYRIKIVQNDTLLNDRDDYLLFDDTFGLSFFEEGLELNYAFEENDRIRLVLFRLNESVFDYFNQLVGLLFTDGGLFSPPPQNPETNIVLLQGEARPEGYFMVSPIISENIFIAPEEDKEEE
ncbi:DUF4249 family protein [Algoriphagus sediminis]|uniref:DUF4249 family protein n=1 Tax=Algoriphagus sediminis TaxID=3057113 RepID=A0ABT7YAB9_9BACT|nr:DUF4249 family protein [Algoriphagus sediminis]MDN3203453.1 DUF4249 family protein [Algoriphagus sediminis]